MATNNALNKISDSFVIDGTGGNGFIQYNTQSSDPAVGPTSSVKVYASSAGLLSFLPQTDGFSRRFSGTLTASRTFSYPNLTGTIVVTASTPTDGQIPIGATSTGQWAAATIASNVRINVVVGTNTLTLNGQFSQGYVSGLDSFWTSTTVVGFNAGACRSFDNTLDMVTAGTTSVNIGSSGANGLDTGVKAANTWYRLFIIGDSTGVNSPVGILSLSATPTFPAGYNKFRRVGAVRTNASSNILKFNSVGTGSYRQIFWDDVVASFTVLTNGAATTFTAVSLVSSVAPISAFVYLYSYFNNSALLGGAADQFIYRPTGSAVTIANSVNKLSPGSKTSAAGLYGVPTQMYCDGSQSIDYAVTSANDTLTIVVQGYVDNV